MSINLDNWPELDEIPFSAKLKASVQDVVDQLTDLINSIQAGSGDVVAANAFSEYLDILPAARANLDVFSIEETDQDVADGLTSVGFDLNTGDVALASGLWVAGTITGGVVRNATSLQLTQAYTQTVSHADDAVGNAVRFTWDVTATDNDTGNGPVLLSHGQNSPGVVFQFQGHQFIGANQTRFAWSPIGWQTQTVYGNLPSAGNLTLGQGWDFLSARLFLTDTHTVLWQRNDSALGGAAFTDNQLWITQNGGIAGTASGGQEVISHLSLPFMIGNITKTARVGYDSVDINNNGGGSSASDAVTLAFLRAGAYPGADDQNLVLPLNIGYRARHMTHGDHPIGFHNASGAVEVPFAAVVAAPLTGVTTTVSSSLFTKTAHGLTNGQAVVPSGFTGTTGFTGTVYYVVGATANTFQLSKWPTVSGTPITMGGTNDTGITVTLALPSGATLLGLVASAPLTLTATPTLADGTGGERVTIWNVSASPVTLQDDSILPGSNLKIAPNTGTVVLAQGESITVRYNALLNGWIKEARTNQLRGQPTVDFPSGGQARFRDSFGIIGAGLTAVGDTTNSVAMTATPGAGLVTWNDGTGSGAQSVSLSRPDNQSIRSSAGLSVSGVGGATQPSRWYGGTASAFFPPAGPNLVGDWVTVATGQIQICITAGTPGEWVTLPNADDVATIARVLDAFLRSDAGAAVSNTVTETTLFAGSLYDIPANSLAVGDVIEIVCWGTYLNDSGANRNVAIKSYFDAVQVGGTQGSAIPAAATARSFESIVKIRIGSLGATGTTSSSTRLGMSSFGADFQQVTTQRDAVIDTTQALTVDVKATLSAATATETITCKGLTVRKIPAP